MRKFLFLLIVSTLSCTACSITRSISKDPAQPGWVGCEALDILQAMGNPDAIDADGKGGSILRYKSAVDDTDPEYDILDPEASRTQEYAYFFLDEEGYCYRVDANRDLPSPPVGLHSGDDIFSWFDLMVYLPLLIVGILL